MTNITTLNNGLRVVTEKIPSVKTVSVGAFVKVGARHESESLNGISHFLEHMAFKGTDRRSAEQISFEIETVGGVSNAWTSHEMTAYHAKMLSDHTDLALDIISDSLMNSTYLEKEIETERGVILQEISRSFDDPSGIAFDGVVSTAYKDQSIGREVLGTVENVKSFKQKDFIDYIGTHYGSNRMIVSAAGDVKHDQFVGLVEKHFGKLAPSAQDHIESVTFSSGYFHYDKDFEQSTAIAAWNATSLVSKDRIKWLLYSQYLGGGMSSPMFQVIREKRGLVYSVSTGTHLQENTGLFYLYAGTSKEHLPELLKVGKGEIEKTLHAIDPAHLTRAKNQLKVSLWKSTENQSAMMTSLASSLHFRGKIEKISKLIKKIDAITEDDLKSVANSILNSAPVLSIVGKTEDVDYLEILN